MPSDRPSVTIFNAASVDGRLDGFEPDLGLFYRLAAALPQQATLAGSATLVAAARSAGVRLDEEEAEPDAAPGAAAAARPWLVVVDSAGRITRFDWLRRQPHWRDVIVFCSAATPEGHLVRLRRLKVLHHVVGAERVDLPSALRLLAAEYGVRRVRVDAGPGLNGALFRAGVVDEVHVLVAPWLVGPGRQALRLVGGELNPTELHLRRARAVEGGYALLEYTVAP